ncbi:MAG: helix-turn-helix domain-containing protein [Syntrophomonadaceae bacterium]|jgi:hypothetical protein
MAKNYDKGSYPPWSRVPALNEMCQEAGIDFDSFISDLKVGTGINDMAEKYGVSINTISLLEEHFMKYGISSVIGGD